VTHIWLTFIKVKDLHLFKSQWLTFIKVKDLHLSKSQWLTFIKVKDLHLSKSQWLTFDSHLLKSKTCSYLRVSDSHLSQSLFHIYVKFTVLFWMHVSGDHFVYLILNVGLEMELSLRPSEISLAAIKDTSQNLHSRHVSELTLKTSLRT
jgi:hypothetical protein